MCDKPLSSKMFPSLLITEADEIREASRSFCGLPYPGDSASFNRPLLSLDKLVSQLPSLVLRWQVGSLHKPPHRMRGCLTRCSSICVTARMITWGSPALVRLGRFGFLLMLVVPAFLLFFLFFPTAEKLVMSGLYGEKRAHLSI